MLCFFVSFYILFAVEVKVYEEVKIRFNAFGEVSFRSSGIRSCDCLPNSHTVFSFKQEHEVRFALLNIKFYLIFVKQINKSWSVFGFEELGLIILVVFAIVIVW